MWVRANGKRAPTGESVPLAKSGGASFYLGQEAKQGSARSLLHRPTKYSSEGSEDRRQLM